MNLKKNIFYKKNNLNKILLIGLHGSGKTTSIVKLAKFLKIKNKRNPIIIGCDIHRPAAMEQLEILSKKASIDYLIPELNENLDFFLKKAIIFSEKNKHDYLLIDSAGRLHTDEKMMHEILKIEEIINPDEIILVMDSIFGKDAIKYFDSFNKKIKISGFILTKMDSDSKGGIILTLGYSTTIPIKFIGNGEGLDDLEIFNPNGITSRILGMGDISSLIEEIQSEKNNTVSDELTLRDLQMQMKQIINKGSIKNIIEKLPGAHLMQTSSKDENNEKFIKMYSIINSMTEKEKLFPNIINGSRKRRIAKGSGTDIKEVNKLLKNFHKIKNMNKKKFFLQNFYKEKI